MEEWRNIQGYDGLYKVSRHGEVKSVDREIIRSDGKIKHFKSVVLKQFKNNNGYLLVVLSKNGVEKQYLVHRLVAEAFIPNPHNLPQVNHKDENKLNNCVDNLEWMDAKTNSNYGTGIERRITKISKAVLQFTITGDYVAEYKSTREAQRKTGIDHGDIGKCCNGKQTTPGGFIWRYKYSA